MRRSAPRASITRRNKAITAEVQGYSHLFGRDLASHFDLRRFGASFVVLTESDAVTGVDTAFHFFSKDKAATAPLATTIDQILALMHDEPRN
jgi:hypothetical protein